MSETTNTTETTTDNTATANPAPAPESQADATTAQTTAPEATANDYSIDYPEGHEVFNDVKTSFEDLVKTVGLNKEQAQKLVELGMNQSQQIIAAQDAKKAAEVAQWEASTKADKELGGDRLTETLSVAGKALEQFTTPEFKQLLNQTGIGNHPEMIRMFYKIGQSISEDNLVNGHNSNRQELSTDPMRRMEQIASTLYPTS